MHYISDEDKLSYLFEKLAVDLGALSIDIKNSISRLGKIIEGKPKQRVIKLNAGSSVNRDKILVEAKKLKSLIEPLKNVYIKEDKHPVELAEFHRIRLKFNSLKNLPENLDKNVKLEKGRIYINGEIIDKNLFFR